MIVHVVSIDRGSYQYPDSVYIDEDLARLRVELLKKKEDLPARIDRVDCEALGMLVAELQGLQLSGRRCYKSAAPAIRRFLRDAGIEVTR